MTNRLRWIEERLERLLASGWRNARAEVTELGAEADALAEVGLPSLADRLRAVVTAADSEQALSAVALAAAHCRMLRVRLPADEAPAGEWKPLESHGRRQSSSIDRLLPVARMVVAGTEVWSCARLRGAAAIQWLLVEPVQAPEQPSPQTPTVTGLVSHLLRPPAPTDPESTSPMAGAHHWLRRPIQGRLRWRARHPLGATGEVDLCVLTEPSWLDVPNAEDDPATRFRVALWSGDLEDNQPVLNGGGALRVKRLERADATSYVWVDSAASSVLMAQRADQCWALAWTQGALVAPLAIVLLGELLRNPQMVHLVPGAPAEWLLA